jgi:hypothetical protein
MISILMPQTPLMRYNFKNELQFVGCQDSVVTVSRLWAGQFGVQIQILAEVRDLSILQNMQTGSEAHPASC